MVDQSGRGWDFAKSCASLRTGIRQHGVRCPSAFDYRVAAKRTVLGAAKYMYSSFSGGKNRFFMVGKKNVLFTDNKFTTVGVGVINEKITDVGRYSVTHNETDRGKFEPRLYGFSH